MTWLPGREKFRAKRRHVAAEVVDSEDEVVR
jgi:hypothetical protein